MSDWKRGDVVSIADDVHPQAVCILTTDALINDSGEIGAWMLLDETCLMWRTTTWVELREPKLLVREAISQDSLEAK